MASLATEFIDILVKLRDNHHKTFYAMREGCRFIEPDEKMDGERKQCLYFGRPRATVCALEVCPLLIPEIKEGN